MARDPNNYPAGNATITASKNSAGKPKSANAGRVMSISGPKSSVTKGDLSPRTSAPIVNMK